jgi:hypothetical protein
VILGVVDVGLPQLLVLPAVPVDEPVADCGQDEDDDGRVVEGVDVDDGEREGDTSVPDVEQRGNTLVEVDLRDVARVVRSSGVWRADGQTNGRTGKDAISLAGQTQVVREYEVMRV